MIRAKKFLSYYKPYRRLFASVMACALVSAAITLIIPLIARHVTQNVLSSFLPNRLTEVYRLGVVMGMLILLQMAVSFYVDYRGHAMGARMESDLRRELFEHYQKLGFTFYDQQRTGQLMSRITNDLLSLAELYHHAPEDILIYLVKFAGAFVILTQINLELTLTVFLFLPFLAVFAIFFNRRMHASFMRNKQRIAEINAQVEDNLAGIRVVKSFANEPVEIGKFSLRNQRFLDSRKDIYRNEAYLFNGVNTFTQMILVAVIIFGSAGIVNARLNLADLIVFLLYIGNITEPIQKFLNIAYQYQEGITGFERFMEILEIQPDIQDSAHAVNLPTVRGQISFKNVSFRYHEGHNDVLTNISLEVNSGETIALVGTSGVGKTTLVSLIPRFYETSAGEIQIDGINIKDIRLDFLHRNVGVVQQDVYLFAGSVYENIRYGWPDASREEIITAAKQANAHDFIMQLPDGYDTDIGQRGVKLSGGQKQRLSIARVFLKNPPVLIFDEATSALDLESERAVQESMTRLAENRTTFIIAHRLSTVRNADRIIVLTGRGIEEQGSHAELIARSGAYAQLYRLQVENSMAASHARANMPYHR